MMQNDALLLAVCVQYAHSTVIFRFGLKTLANNTCGVRSKFYLGCVSKMRNNSNARKIDVCVCDCDDKTRANVAQHVTSHTDKHFSTHCTRPLCFFLSFFFHLRFSSSYLHDSYYSYILFSSLLFLNSDDRFFHCANFTLVHYVNARSDIFRLSLRMCVCAKLCLYIFPLTSTNN